MKEIKWYGYSDDSFCYADKDGFGDSHDNCANMRMMAFKVTSGDEGLIVTGQYSPKPMANGTWVIGLSLLEEDKPLPNWPMRWETEECCYSPRLVMEVPDDALIEDITNSKD